MYGIGLHLDKMLTKRKMTRASLAEKLNLSVQQISSIIKNRSLTTTKNLKLMSEILDVPSDYLLQDFDKQFLVNAIDEYIEKIDKEQAQIILSDLLTLLQSEETDHG